jgi:capsular polysaccharide biosynthesis protein
LIALRDIWPFRAKQAPKGFALGDPRRPMVYRHILIHPPRESYLYESLFDGGPDWPDWDAPSAARHFRRDQPIDRRPTLSDAKPERLTGPAIWGGNLNPHFGHLIAEYAPRIGFAAAALPQAPVLFQTFPGWTTANMPAHVWEVLAHYGLSRDRVRLIDRPLLAESLHVWPQAEQLNQTERPHPAWLARLNRLATAAALQPAVCPLLYVTRQGMMAAGSGGFAGEDYLVETLQRAGVAILDPARTPLRDQLSAYLGAQHLIFAEGSALHGRQMLGRLDQGLTVLNRTPKARLARAVLRPRVRALDYIEATRQRIEMMRPGGVILSQKAVSLLDFRAVLDRFASLGVDLHADWDDQAFARAERADLKLWLARIRPDGTDPAGRPLDLAATRARIAPLLQQAGHGDLLEGTE